MQPRPDYDRVMPRLYQGGAVDPNGRYEQFTTIVLCAIEHQPRMSRFRGKVIRPAFNDTQSPTPEEIHAARVAAARVAVDLWRGGRVLVTCAKGWNRSGLVTGFALALTSSLGGEAIIRRIRGARGHNALSNLTFAALVQKAHEQAAIVRGEPSMLRGHP